MAGVRRTHLRWFRLLWKQGSIAQQVQRRLSRRRYAPDRNGRGHAGNGSNTVSCNTKRAGIFRRISPLPLKKMRQRRLSQIFQPSEPVSSHRIMGDTGEILPASGALYGNASALSPLAANGRYCLGHCCWLCCFRAPGSAWLADVRACWLHDGRSRSPRQPPTRRGDPRRGPPHRQPLHPLGNQPRLPPRT